MLWKRYRRRSFAPRRPAVFPSDLPLVIFTLLVIAGGIAFVGWVFTL